MQVDKMQTALALPSYLDLSPELLERFNDIESRETILEIKNIHKDFTKNSSRNKKTENLPPPILGDISFEVKRREFICIIGSSGCGKSTLLRILGGLESYSKGTVKVS